MNRGGGIGTPLPAFGYVRFRTVTPSATVDALVTPGVARITEGYAKWTVIARARRKGITEYEGHDPIVLTVPILFDGFKRKQSVESQIALLDKMARSPGGITAPPAVHVSGSLPRMPRQGIVWAIAGLDWSEEDVIYHPVTRERMRQGGTVTLRELSPDERLVPQWSGRWHRYRVKKGDTVRKIAQRNTITKQEQAWYYRVVLKKNKLRVGQKLKVGRILLIP